MSFVVDLCLYTHPRKQYIMMAMVEEAAIEMGSTGSVGGALNTGSVIVTDNMPEDLVTETEEER